jgi:hypothetical protein
VLGDGLAVLGDGLAVLGDGLAVLGDGLAVLGWGRTFPRHTLVAMELNPEIKTF